jgi:hypothetical protein
VRTVLVVLLLLALSIDAADARRRGHRHHRHYGQVYVIPQDALGMTASALSRRELRRLRAERVDMGPPGAAPRAYGQLVPSSWQLEPPNPSWSGKRFVSPDRAAWLATYASTVEPEPIPDHMKTVAFGEGEEITYLRGERDWIAVSGLKGDRIFYRKAVLACGGKVWRHIAFEYPAGDKRRMDAFVSRVAAAVTDTMKDGCEAASPEMGSRQ